MISYLSGKVIFQHNNSLILDISGVGYEVSCPSKLVDSISHGDEIEIFVKTIVKEDDISLYGFDSLESKRWFETITSVQGVGAKMGLMVLSAYQHDKLYDIIISEDVSALKAISGIGPKVASRIINELKSKKDLNIGVSIQSSNNNLVSQNSESDALEKDAMSALINLGFQRKDVFFALKKITANNDNLDLEQMIKEALIELN